MIDLREFRENPQRFIDGARDKGIVVDFDLLKKRESDRRDYLKDIESLRAEQNQLSKESGPRIAALMKLFKSATQPEEKEHLTRELNAARARPTDLKGGIQLKEKHLRLIENDLQNLLLQVPLPPDPDVPKGRGADDNVEIRRWNPDWFDTKKSFIENKGFAPKTHLQLMRDLRLVDFERAVKMAGTRHYVMTGDGMRLYQAVLRFAFDYITNECGFTPMSVPVIVREECMTGTGFFPAGREQAYHIEESKRGSGHDIFLTGTGEVGLMGLHADEIIDADKLPLQYATVSTCFRREAGAAGKDTAGLYRVHQFDKVEQVVICRADESESRQWHAKMIGIVEELLRRLELPHRLLQCCTGDLGPKNADMIDIETWMPSRGREDASGIPTGEYGETHSASRLYDFQCRRLNLRYRGEDGKTVFCHSLNNTVAACPRLLIPILELYQNQDGSVTIPGALRPHMGGRDRIG